MRCHAIKSVYKCVQISQKHCICSNVWIYKGSTCRLLWRLQTVDVSELFSHSSPCADTHVKQMLWNCDKNNHGRGVYKTMQPSLCIYSVKSPPRVTDRVEVDWRQWNVWVFPDLVLRWKLLHVSVETPEAWQEVVDHHLLRNDCTGS